MDLRPVYLVQPEPEARTFSRRTLVVGLATAALGGAAVGTWVGARWLGTPTVPDRRIDPAVQWAMDLQNGPPHTLLADHLGFLSVLGGHPTDADLLLDGVRCLVDFTRDSAMSNEQSRALSQNIASAIIASGTKHSELLAISRELSKR